VTDFRNVAWLGYLPDVTPVDLLTDQTKPYVLKRMGVWGIAVNIEKFSARIVDVPVSQLRVPVYVQRKRPANLALPESWVPDPIPFWGGVPGSFLQHGVPIPPGVDPQQDSDSALIVNVRNSRAQIIEQYELWQYRISPFDGRIFCSHGGRKMRMDEMQGFYHDDGGATWTKNAAGTRVFKSVPYTYQSKDMGTMATGLPMHSTIMSRRDLENGVCDHPVGIMMPSVWPSQVTHRWPAQRHDNSSSAQFPQGTRFRLPYDASVPVDATPAEACFVRTARSRGVIHVDMVGGSVPVIRLGSDCREFLADEGHLRYNRLRLEQLQVLPERYLDPLSGAGLQA
jgi:hypothetical protein